MNAKNKPFHLDLERSIEIMNSDGTNDERQTDFGSTNSSQTSRGDRRAKKTSGSRYKLSREGMKRFLIDQVAKNGHLQFEYLHEVTITRRFSFIRSLGKDEDSHIFA